MYKWVCRAWTHTAIDGWLSVFASFDTEEEAIEYGEAHKKQKRRDEIERDYEIMEATDESGK